MAKRGQHEGSIYKRKDGRWAAGLTTRNGRRKYLYASTQHEVMEKLRKARNAEADHVRLPAGRKAVGRFLDDWLEETAMHKLRPRTFADYSLIVRRHLSPEIGRIKLAELDPDDVQRLLNKKRKTGLSASRLNAIQSVLSAALKTAVKHRHLSRNVARDVEPSRVTGHKVEPLTPSQVRLLLEASKDHRLHALYVLAATSGLRQGECLGLTWDAVDLDDATIEVRASLQRINGELQLVDPKTDRSRRRLAITTSTAAVLRTHRARQLEERMRAGPEWHEQDLVFTTEIGTPIDASNLARQFKRLLKAADLPERRFHDLRHGVATTLFAQGVHLRTVADLLGHSSVAVTSDIYTHGVGSVLRDAAEKMDSAIAG